MAAAPAVVGGDGFDGGSSSAVGRGVPDGSHNNFERMFNNSIHLLKVQAVLFEYEYSYEVRSTSILKLYLIFVVRGLCDGSY